jgi:hypothetical protein
VSAGKRSLGRAREAIGAGVEGVEFGAKKCAAVFVARERLAFVPEVAREGVEGTARVREFEDAACDEHQISQRIGERTWNCSIK